MSLDPTPKPPSALLRSVEAHDAERPWSLNAERREHWREHRKLTAEARDRWGWLWRTAGAHRLQFARVEVVAQPSYSHHPQDTAACVGSVKAAVDALVDVGCIPDDTGAHVASVLMLAPVAGKDGLTVTVREVR